MIALHSGGQTSHSSDAQSRIDTDLWQVDATSIRRAGKKEDGEPEDDASGRRTKMVADRFTTAPVRSGSMTGSDRAVGTASQRYAESVPKRSCQSR